MFLAIVILKLYLHKTGAIISYNDAAECVTTLDSTADGAEETNRMAMQTIITHLHSHATAVQVYMASRWCNLGIFADSSSFSWI